MRTLIAVCLFAAVPARADDEQLLRSSGLGVDGPSLLEFLRHRSADRPARDRIERLIEQGDGKAVRELVSIGRPALPSLRQALANPEQSKNKARVEQCIKWIDGPEAVDLPLAVVRVLGRKTPDGLVPVLLAFLPKAEEDAVSAEVREVLTGLAYRDGKSHPDLLAVVRGDADVDRKLTAAEVLARAGSPAGFAGLRQLMKEALPSSRLKAARVALELGEVEAVPVLIDLLPHPQGTAALEALHGLAAPLGPPGGSPPPAETFSEKGRALWADWWKTATAPALLDYFRKRTPTADPDTVPELVKQLGSKVFREREKAADALVLMRGLSVSHLEKALEDPDIEVRRRADRCLARIRSAPDAGQSAAHVRLLAVRAPQEATTTLLAYVAFADDDSVVDTVRRALPLLARKGAEARTALAAALADRAPLRRALAAEALAEVGRRPRDDLRRLLTDPEPLVRGRVALALVKQRDRQAVAPLIDELHRLPTDLAFEAEDLLRRLAGDKAPTTTSGDDEAARRKARAAWTAWWKAHERTADLERLRGPAGQLGFTVLSLWNGSNVNAIVELGRDNKERWKIDNLGYAFDFEVLPGNRVLCAEHNQNRVTERNLKGEVLWEYKVPSPINCQRLPGGHTFVVASGRVVEVDRQGNELFNLERFNSIMGGQRTRDGQIFLTLSEGAVVRLDPRGNEVKRWTIGGVNNYGGVHALPGNRLLVALYNQNEVFEYDQDGKLLWSAKVQSPNFATRLPNGHTLVGSQDQRSMVELDRQGKVVSEYKPQQSVWRIHRR